MSQDNTINLDNLTEEQHKDSVKILDAKFKDQIEKDKATEEAPVM